MSASCFLPGSPPGNIYVLLIEASFTCRINKDNWASWGDRSIKAGDKLNLTTSFKHADYGNAIQ